MSGIGICPIWFNHSKQRTTQTGNIVHELTHAVLSTNADKRKVGPEYYDEKRIKEVIEAVNLGDAPPEMTLLNAANYQRESEEAR